MAVEKDGKEILSRNGFRGSAKLDGPAIGRQRGDLHVNTARGNQDKNLYAAGNPMGLGNIWFTPKVHGANDWRNYPF